MLVARAQNDITVLVREKRLVATWAETAARLSDPFPAERRKKKTCYICQNRLQTQQARVFTGCGHSFHTKCLVLALSN